MSQFEDDYKDLRWKSKRVNWVCGWIFVRPQRWFFRNMIRNTHLRPWFEEDVFYGTPFNARFKYRLPNTHWWILYKTVYSFFHWLNWNGWQSLCKFENRRLVHEPLIAKIIHRIGQTTAGYAQSGFECHHCASPDGCQVELSDSDEHFELLKEWSSSTEDGTDYQYYGITTCPKCGYKAEYQEGSL